MIKQFKKSIFFFTEKARFWCPCPANFPGLILSPALLGDYHLGLVPVELEPQRPVAEVHLGLHPGARRRHRYVAESRPRTAVGRVDAAGALAELVRRAEVTPSRGGGGEPRGRQHGAQVERRGVPAGAGRGVNRRTGRVGDERAVVRGVRALFRTRGRDVVGAVRPHRVLRVPAAGSGLVPIHSRRLAPVLRSFLRRSEGAAFPFAAQHACCSPLVTGVFL